MIPSPPKPKPYWSLLSVLVVMIFLLTLAVSGVRVQDTIAAREPNSPWGQIIATVAALGVESTTALISYRIFHLQRQGRPVPRALIWGLVFFISVSVSANVDHSFRYTQATLAGRSGIALYWEVLLSFLLAIAAPSGLLLFAEVLSEYIQGVDVENATLLENYQNQVRKMEERERRKEERVERRSMAESRTGGQVSLDKPETPLPLPEGNPVLATEAPRTNTDWSDWESVRRLAGKDPFSVELVCQALGLRESAAYERLKDALSAGLVQRHGRGKYRFSGTEWQPAILSMENETEYPAANSTQLAPVA